MTEIRLDSNEFPEPLPAAVQTEVVAAWAALATNRYPDPGFKALRRELGAPFGLTEDEVTCGVGGDELIENLILAFTREGERVVMPEPSFSSFSATTAQLKRTLVAPRIAPPFAFDVRSLLDSRGELLFLAWPNNPTGALYPETEVLELLQRWPGVSVLDESYWEFSGRSLLDRRSELPRTLFLRTFSKGLRLAGLRCGYIFGTAELIRRLHRQKLYFNLPAPTIAAARVVWRHREAIWSAIPEVRARRDATVARLNALPGVAAYPSAANFVLFRVVDAAAVHGRLSARAIRVRRFTDSLASDHLRVTIGTAAEMDAFFAALAPALREGAA